MRVPLQCLLNQESKGSESAAHIGVAGRKPNSYVARDRNHRRSSTSRTRAKAAASTFASTRTRRPPPRLISISPLRPEVAGRNCGSSPDGGFGISATRSGPAIRTAAKRDTTAAGASIARACRRRKEGLPKCGSAGRPRKLSLPAPAFLPRVVSSRRTTTAAAAQRRQEPQPASVDLKARLKVACFRKARRRTRRRRSDGYASMSPEPGEQGL